MQGTVAVADLATLALAPGVALVRPPLEPLAATTSEGVTLIGPIPGS